MLTRWGSPARPETVSGETEGEAGEGRFCIKRALDKHRQAHVSEALEVLQVNARGITYPFTSPLRKYFGRLS